MDSDESLHAHHHRASQASVEDVDDREEGKDVEDGAIVGQEGHQVMWPGQKMFSKNTCKVRQFLRPEAGNFKFQRLHLNLWLTIRTGRWQCDLWVPRCSRWCPAARPPWRRAAGCTIWKYCSMSFSGKMKCYVVNDDISKPSFEDTCLLQNWPWALFQSEQDLGQLPMNIFMNI